MSRNIRNKTLKTVPARKTKVAPSSIASDDDDYAALDEISDSDDEEPDVELAEEQAIIASLANGSDEEDDADDESNDDDDDDDAPQPDQDDEDEESFNGFPDEPADFFNEQLPPAVRRRVRFDLDEEEVDYSSASDTDSGGYTFPDLMAEEDLDDKFRQQIQNDDNIDEDNGSETEWDWENAAGNYAAQNLLDLDNEEDLDLKNIDGDDYSSSDFDSEDEGETTEEDLNVAARVHFNPSRTLRQRRDHAESSSEEEVAGNRTPKLGTWFNTGKQSFAVTDHSSQKLMVFMAKAERRYSFGSVQRTPQTQSPHEPLVPFSGPIEPYSDLPQMIMASPGDVMLGSNNWMSTNDGFMMSPETFTGATSFSLNQIIGSQSSSTTEEDLDHRAIEVDFGDFLHHDFSSDDDVGPSSPATLMASSPSNARRPSTAMSLGSQGTENDLLSHLESVGVGAFRRNQNHHRLITRNNESHESLAFSTPTHEGTLRGIKQGKLAAVNIPMTPGRKTKIKPEAIPQMHAKTEKRKFSGEPTRALGHKRTRSMV